MQLQVKDHLQRSSYNKALHLESLCHLPFKIPTPLKAFQWPASLFRSSTPLAMKYLSWIILINRGKVERNKITQMLANRPVQWPISIIPRALKVRSSLTQLLEWHNSKISSKPTIKFLKTWVVSLFLTYTKCFKLIIKFKTKWEIVKTQRHTTSNSIVVTITSALNHKLQTSSDQGEKLSKGHPQRSKVS